MTTIKHNKNGTFKLVCNPLGNKVKTTSVNEFKNLNNLLSDPNEFKIHFNNLRNVRDGLYKIITDRPELQNIISNQFNTLNVMIDALIKDTGYCYQTDEYKEHFKH